MRFGDIATFRRGLTYSKGDVDSGTSKRVLRSNNIDLATNSLNFDDIACLKESFIIPEEKKLHRNDIFICMSNGSTQHLGKVAFIDTDLDYAFGGFMGAIHPNELQIVPKYAYYACLSLEYRRFLASILNGININNLKWSDLSNFTISIPSLTEQQSVVEELDLLEGIIDKQKAQLKELDVLAKSVFYDMFGTTLDEKGWEVKAMGDVGTFQRGSGLSKQDLIDAGCPCILYGQIHTRFGAFTKRHLACIPNELVHTAKIAHPGDVIMAITSEDVEGSCKSTAWLGEYDVAVGSDTAIYRHSLNGIYVSYYTQTQAFFNEKAKYAHGFKVTHISTKEIATIPIPIPPLNLQESFAQRIQAIENQKETINKAIKETQTLFDYTMDKYFG